MLDQFTDSSHIGLLVHSQHMYSFMPQLPEQLSSAIKPDPVTAQWYLAKIVKQSKIAHSCATAFNSVKYATEQNGGHFSKQASCFLGCSSTAVSIAE